VTTPSGTSPAVTGDHFTYSAASVPTVSGVIESIGPTAGQIYVTITGSHFSGASAVKFGSTPVVSYRVVSDSMIFVVAPAESAGTMHVKVTTPSGTSSTVSADHFTYGNDAGPGSLTGTGFGATVGVAVSGVTLATFCDPDTSGTASQWAAYINWGNGEFTLGQVVYTGNDWMGRPQFAIHGSGAIYSASGNYTVTIYVYDIAGGTGSIISDALVM
jgi:IPT/TIG domain